VTSPPVGSTVDSRRSVDVRLCVRWSVAALVLSILFCAAFFFTAAHDQAAWFVHFGRNTRPIQLAYKILGPHVRVPQTDGQDGRFFWVVARDPLLLHAKNTAMWLDRPAYRAQRILYPGLAAPWRLLGEQGLLWGLILTNVVAVAVGTGLTCALAQDIKVPSYTALAFAFAPAVLIALGFDMGDPIALAATVAVVLFLRRRAFAWAVAAAVVGTLAKEPTLFAVGALALLAPGFELRDRIRLVAVPAAAAGAWALYLRWRLGWPPSQIQEFTAVPFSGYLDAYRRGWRPVGNYSDAMIALIIVVLAIVTVAMWWRQRDSLLLIAALPYALIMPFMTAQVLDLQDNAWRAFGPALTLLVLTMYEHRARTARARLS